MVETAESAALEDYFLSEVLEDPGAMRTLKTLSFRCLIDRIAPKTNPPFSSRKNGGVDGTRTRGLRRDRAAF